MSLLNAIGIPLVLAVLMSLIFGKDPAAPHGVLLVADEDNTVASGRMLDAFHREPLRTMVRIENVSAAQGRERIDRGDGSAFLLIPKGLQQSFLTNAPTRLQLFTNPSQSVLPGIIEEALSVTTDAVFYLRRGSVLPEFDGANLIRLKTTLVAQRKRSISFAAAFLPSMIFMGLLFTANSMAIDIWKERMFGTLRRTAASPVSLPAYLFSRVVFVILVYVLVAIVGLTSAKYLAGMPVSNLAVASAWMTFVGVVFYLFFTCLTLQASTMRAASVMTNLFIFPLAMLGGCFFPFEWMPPWMAAVGRFTPNGFAITQFKSILAGEAHATTLAAATAALTAFACVAFLYAARRLQKVVC